MGLQTALNIIYPPQCLTCGALVEDHDALCGACWRDMHFLDGQGCAACALPLPGEVDAAQRSGDDLCDTCLNVPRPWNRGHAALLYSGKTRRLVMALKYGDGTTLARPAAAWMAHRLPPLDPQTLVVPVPLHWWRFVRRRYNQAALLAGALSRECGLEHLPDALRRTRATKPLDGKSADTRFADLENAIAVTPRQAARLAGRPVLLVDDVMTSGATLSAASHALRQAGVARIDVAVLARVAKSGEVA